MEHAYRKTDASVASILREYEVSRGAFDDHRKRGGWLREHPNANGPASVRAAAAPVVVGGAAEGEGTGGGASRRRPAGGRRR